MNHKGEIMDDYENLLNRAIDQLPPEVFESKRFEPIYSKLQGRCRLFKQRPSAHTEIPAQGIRYCWKP